MAMVVAEEMLAGLDEVKMAFDQAIALPTDPIGLPGASAGQWTGRRLGFHRRR